VEKSPEAFRTISEAAEELSLPQHVLRFWETRFTTIKPLKRGGGRRYYRPEDVLLLKGIRHLLYDQGFTIKGVQRILKDQGSRFVTGIGEGNPVGALMKQPVDDEDDETAVAPVALMARNGLLDAADREKLGAVLRDLLECKRMLERAREG
jgi:DNA-binding transcriptional MerR regulator